MNMFKRVLATLLMLVMLMQPFATAASVTEFLDFPNDWSTEAMTAAVENGLLIGNGNKLIEPNRNLRRSELAAIITRAFGATITADIGHFEDVKPGDWYYNAVSEAVQMGAMNGTSSTSFHPENSVTREEVFTTLARVLCLEGTDTSVLDKFSDSNEISDWALESVIGLVANGYINGYPNGTLDPTGEMTRAELAQMFHNLFKTYIDTAGYHTRVAAEGSVIVRASGARLENVVINGDLIIADGVGAGNFNANTVTVNGRILARGGEGTVTFKKVTATDKVIIFDRNGVVNFNNYRTDVPFKNNLIEHTPATFLSNKPISGSGSSTGGGGSPTRYYVYFYNGDDIHDTLSVRAGDPVSEPTKKPEKPGAVFKYWGSSAGAETAFDFANKKITSNTNIFAVYEYTVSFDGNVSPAQTILHGKKVTRPADPTPAVGMEFKHWSTTADGEAYNFDTEVTDSFTLYPVYGTSKYEVKFEGYAAFEVEHGNKIPAGNIPGKGDMDSLAPEGYEFDGWTAKYEDGTPDEVIPYDDIDDYVVTKPVQFIPHFVKKEYKVGFDVNADGTNETETTVEHGEKLPAGIIPDESAVTVPAGQRFAGWTANYENGQSEVVLVDKIADYTVKQPVVFTPYFIPEDMVTVIFYNNGSQYGAPQVIVKGTKATRPATDPEKDRAEFKHWGVSEESEESFDFGKEITTDLNIYAVYEYTVSFDGNVSPAQKILHGKQVTKPADPAAPAGKLFKHWSTSADGEEYLFTSKVTDSFTLYPVFEDAPVTQYTVIFIVDGNEASREVVDEGGVATRPADPTAPAGKKFSHWSVTPDGTEYDFTTPVFSDIDIYAVFVPEIIEKFDVVFKVDGNPVHSEEVYDGEYASGPATDPADTADKYFAGWIVEGDTTETVVDLTTYAITADTVFVALYKNKLVVSFYDLTKDPGRELIHTAYVAAGETLAEDQYPDESSLDFGVKGYVKNSSIHSVYSGVDFVHKVPMSYWYVAEDGDTEWTAFDSDVVINEDTNVYLNIKRVQAVAKVPQLNKDFSLSLWANYDDNTRVIDTVKDILFINTNVIVAGYGDVEDTLMGKLIEKEVIDEDYNIKNIHKFISLVDVLGKDRIRTMIWEVAGDSIDTTAVATWIKNNFIDKYAALSEDEKDELIKTFETLFDTIIADAGITDREKQDVSKIVHDFFMTMSEEDIDDLINHYLCNRLKEGDTDHVKELIVSMLKAFKSVDEEALKDVIADFIVSQLGENIEIKALVTGYIKNEVINGNYGDTLIEYIKLMVDDSNENAASNKATITSIIKEVANTNFEIVEDAISDKLDTDDSFAKTVINTAIDAENPAFRAVINNAIVDATGAPITIVETMSTADIKNEFNDEANADELNNYMDTIVAAAINLMKTNATVRNSAIDSYIASVGIDSLAENLVNTLQDNKKLFEDDDVVKILDAAVNAQLELLDEDSQMIINYVNNLVTNENFDVFADAFVKITVEDTRHNIVNSIIHNLLDGDIDRLSLKAVIDELVNEMFEMGHIDYEFIDYFLKHMGDEENAQAFNDFVDLLDAILDDGEQLNNIAAALGHEDASKQTKYVNQLIDELCNEKNITVTADRRFMFDPILEKFADYDYTFVESKVPAKLKQYLPMDKIEELFTRFYDDPVYGYVANLKKAVADAEADPTGVYYVKSGVEIMINPITDIFTPALKHSVDMKALAEGKLADKFPTYYSYYKNNKYAAAIEDYLTTETWFDGSEKHFSEELSGYSIKDFAEYYSTVKTLSVLADDAILYYYNEVPEADRDAVLDVALTKLLDVANIVKGILVDYSVNGIPDNLEDFVKSLEKDPELLKYIEKFGVNAYLDKIAGNANADKVYDTAFDKAMGKFGDRIETLLVKFVESKLNRDYDEGEYDKALEVVNAMFTTKEGDEIYTVDTIFDEYLGGVDLKEVSAKGASASVSRRYFIGIDNAK